MSTPRFRPSPYHSQTKGKFTMAKQRSTPHTETTKKVSSQRKATSSNEATNYGPLALILALILVAVLAALFDASVATSNGAATVEPTAAPAVIEPVLADQDDSCLSGCPDPVTIVTQTNVDWLIFGRLDEEGKYFMGIAGINPALLREGTPLQQYHHQLTDDDYVGLNLPDELEDLNDALKYVLVGNKAFKIPTTGTVAIDSVSWVQYVEGKGLLICRNDSGSAGTWFGNCADTNPTWVTEWVFTEDLLASGEFQPWAAKFTQVCEDFDGIFNRKIEVYTTYR